MIKIVLNPLIKTGVYAEDIEIQEDVLNFGSLSFQLFSQGEIFYASKNNSLTLKINNSKNKYKTFGSIFAFYRNDAKIKVYFNDVLLFFGYLDERLTNENVTAQELQIKAITNDTKINKIKIQANLLNENQNILSALQVIVKNAINIDIDAGDIESDFVLSNIETLNNKNSLKTAGLLALSLGCILIFDKDKIKLRKIGEDINDYRIIKKNQITKITNLNEGFDKVINTVLINDEYIKALDSIFDFGEFVQDLSLPFLSNHQNAIADNVLRVFKYPRKTLEINVNLQDCADVQLLDYVMLDFADSKTPLYNFAQYGETTIESEFQTSETFAVMGIKVNFTSQTIDLLLREREIIASTDVFNFESNLYDFGIYNKSLF